MPGTIREVIDTLTHADPPPLEELTGHMRELTEEAKRGLRETRGERLHRMALLRGADVIAAYDDDAVGDKEFDAFYLKMADEVERLNADGVIDVVVLRRAPIGDTPLLHTIFTRAENGKGEGRMFMTPFTRSDEGEPSFGDMFDSENRPLPSYAFLNPIRNRWKGESPDLNGPGTEHFDEMIAGDLPVLVDFWAEWCGPCKRLEPELEAIEQELEGRLSLAKINIDEEAAVARRFNVMSIPTLILFSGGQEKLRLTGLRSRSELRKELDAALR